MKVRDVLYYIVSSLFSKLLHKNGFIKFASIFSINYKEEKHPSMAIINWLLWPGVHILILSFLILFGCTAIWTIIVGQFIPDSALATYHFFEDKGNLINYTIICPVYIVLTICFLRYIGHLRKDIENTNFYFDYQIARLPVEFSIKKLVIDSLFCILVACIATYFYAVELKKYDFVWWFQVITENGEKQFSSLGVFYLSYNFFMLLIVVAVVAAHFEMFAIAIHIGKGIRNIIENGLEIDDKHFEDKALYSYFQPITHLYTLSKFIVVAFIANMYTWKSQGPSFVGMLELSIAFLALAGVVIISYPKYHIQYWLYKLRISQNHSNYPEIRRPLIVGLASIADILILGNAMTKLILFIFERSGIELKMPF
jgi:hypothetical protein